MRIERVVAGTFSEASERSRKLYGPDVLLLSSSQVGDMHELLLCTDTTGIDDEDASGDTAADTGFVAALHEQMQQRPHNARAERHREPTFSRPEAKPAESGADGASLVGLIRKEFLALERLLATGGVIPRGADQRMALLEQGVSAAYSGRLIDAGVDASSMAARLLADLLSDAAGERLGARPAVLVGPAAVGKTTVAMQTVC
jgi:flagellar biosynthesis GTPase FlhF